jgi:hypothetical protein
MSKYIRHQSVVSRHVDEGIDGDHWLKQFEKSLQKGAVQPKTEQSLFDQINTIMNTKSKYPSVEAAVDDMKERSGLTAYLDRMSKISTPGLPGKKKTAADQNQVIDKKVELMPLVIRKCPQVKNTLENYVRDTKGNLPIPAIIEKIRSIHQGDVSDAKDWDDEKLMHLVSKLNLHAKKNNPAIFENYSNLGIHEKMNDSEIDPSNVDAFHSLNPVKF